MAISGLDTSIVANWDCEYRGKGICAKIAATIAAKAGLTKMRRDTMTTNERRAIEKAVYDMT